MRRGGKGVDRRTWTDEIFGLFVDGQLGRLSASDVRHGIDRIASQPSLLQRISDAPDSERPARLAALVSSVATRSPGRDA